MQKNVKYELSQEILLDKNQKYDYVPQYYGQERFSEEQRVQQGYLPYFNSQSEESFEKIARKWSVISLLINLSNFLKFKHQIY